MNAREQWRTLWDDHVRWTRAVIMSILDESPGLDAATKRLLRNPVDMANALRPLYGASADTFEDLVRSHLTQAVPIVQAAKRRDAATVARLVSAWRLNSHVLAQLMASLNPVWANTEPMWQEHLTATLGEVTAHLAPRTGELAAWDAVHDGAMKMADMFAMGMRRRGLGQVDSGFVDTTGSTDLSGTGGGTDLSYPNANPDMTITPQEAAGAPTADMTITPQEAAGAPTDQTTPTAPEATVPSAGQTSGGLTGAQAGQLLGTAITAGSSIANTAITASSSQKGNDVVQAGQTNQGVQSNASRNVAPAASRTIAQQVAAWPTSAKVAAGVVVVGAVLGAGYWFRMRRRRRR